ncbi:MAG: NAD(P)-binding domain-containing protein [Bacteroidales bacterium]
MRKIGILGSGDVAKTLGNGFIKHGFEVMLGTRTLSKLDEWKKQAGAGAKTGSFTEAAAFGEIVVLATKGSAAKDSLNLAGAGNLKGKTIIDTTNPIADKPPVNGVLQFFTNLDKSLMEELQQSFADAFFVKAFSCIGNPFMVNPDFGGVKPTMFICGNNENSKAEVKKILDLFGFETEDMGNAESARAIEPLCMLWCIPGLRENKWMHAFKLIKK